MAAADIVRRFSGRSVLVIGDVMLDSYFEGKASRLCTEGPVPVVRRTTEVRKPGGAGNVAANLAALGSEVNLAGVVGDDPAGIALRDALSNAGVSDRWLVVDDDASTLHKLRILADGQYVVRFDEGDISRISADSARRLLEALSDAVKGCEAILVSDYAAGTIGEDILRLLPELRRGRDIPLIVDSKSLARFDGTGATVVTPNHFEAALMVSRGNPDDTADAVTLGQRVLRMVDAEHAAITLGSGGVQLAGRDDSSTHFPTHPVHRANDVGAGDTFASALTLSLVCGVGIDEAVQLGIDAAAIAVSRPHTATVNQQELLQRASLRDYSRMSSSGEAALDSLLRSVAVYRASGKRIVFTNGVFDILHAGHIQFLRQARELGDVLIVAVNSDRSTRRLKGRNRPINSESDRLALISALEPVDHAIIFDADTPTEMIRMVRPDIHVKGGDHAGVALPEATAVEECGGEVVILPLAGNVSTSMVIDRILSLSLSPQAGAQVSLG